MNSQRLALVLSGGSARVVTQIGVIKAMEERGIVPDVVVGTSGGAIVGALYATGSSSERIKEYFLRVGTNKAAFIDINFPEILRAILQLDIKKLSGLIYGNRIENILWHALGNIQTFGELEKAHDEAPQRFKLLYITAVNLQDGAATIFTGSRSHQGSSDGFYRICTQLSIREAAHASYTIPGIFKPFACECTERYDCPCPRVRALAPNVTSYKEYYVDGGVREYYPIAVAVKVAGAQRVIGVNLGYSGQRKPGVIDGGLPEILSQVLDIFEVDQLYGDINDKDVSKAKLINITPNIYDVGTFEFHRADELIDKGYALASSIFDKVGLVKSVDYGAQNQARLFSNVSTMIFRRENRFRRIFRR